MLRILQFANPSILIKLRNRLLPRGLVTRQFVTAVDVGMVGIFLVATIDAFVYPRVQQRPHGIVRADFAGGGENSFHVATFEGGKAMVRGGRQRIGGES